MATNNLVPEGAWETHIHVFDPEKFPYSLPRSYTPKAAQLSEYPSSITGCKNIVIVHATVQGHSSAPLLDTLSHQSNGTGLLRGLAVFDPDSITDSELDALHAAGVRGVRLHEMSWGHGTQSDGSGISKKIQALAPRLARLEWAIDIFCPLSAWASMAPMIRQLDPRLKIIADHFGGTFPSDYSLSPDSNFTTFLSLIHDRKIFVKLSGFERLYHDHPQEKIQSLAPIAKAIIAAGPDQIMFGSDWPHTGLGVSRMGKTDQQRLDDIEGFRDVDDEGHIQTLREWIPDEEGWYKFWVANPERVFK